MEFKERTGNLKKLIISKVVTRIQWNACRLNSFLILLLHYFFLESGE